MIGYPKPRYNQKQVRAKRRRKDAKVAKSVRELCVARDGHCRLNRRGMLVSLVWSVVGECSGPSEWAHMVRRSATRGMAPELRHSTKTSIILCRKHHQDEEAHRLHVTGNADGRLCFVNASGDEYRESYRVLDKNTDPRVE